MRIGVSKIFAVAFLASVATAQPAPVPGPPSAGPLVGRSVAPVGVLIAGFDADGDARTSRDELRAGTTRSFGLADGNKDGKLGLIELSTWSTTWLGDASALPGRFDFDRDGDDNVSPTEFVAELERRFVRFDVDKDGLVIRGELLQLPQRAPQRRDRDRLELPVPSQRQ